MRWPYVGLFSFACHVILTAAGLADEAQYVTVELIAKLEAEMLEASENLEFEKAAELRDRINDLEAGPKLEATGAKPRKKKSRKRK